MSPFDRRLDLLETSGQVSPQARRLTIELVEGVEREFRLRLDEDNGAMLVTHLAMSLTRLEHGLVATEVPALVREEIGATTASSSSCARRWPHVGMHSAAPYRRPRCSS